MTLDDFTTYLKGVKRQGSGIIALCPAHDDQKPSLSVSEGTDSRLLLKCHAGCNLTEICSAVGLKLTDLFNGTNPANGQQALHKGRSGKTIVATYDYRNESGTLLFQAIRFQPKNFSQRRPDGHGGWVWNLKNTRRVLYRLPELLAADPTATVFIVEGEKDVERLRALGLVATCNPMGAGKWRDEYSECLRGREIVILPDNDDAGRAHAHVIARALKGVASSIKILELPELPDKGDVSDWFDAGGDAEQICILAEGAPEWEPNESGPGAAGVDSDAKVASGPVAHAEVLVKILDRIGKCDFASLVPGGDVRQKHRVVLTINHLLETVSKNNFALARKNDFVFVYNGEYWREIDRDNLEYFLGQLAQKSAVDDLEAQHYEFKTKLYKQFLAAAHFENVERNNQHVLINLRNGTFEIGEDSQTLRPFKPEDFLTHQLPFEYDAAATCPTFDKYLNDVLPESELQNILAEFFGYIFTRDLKLEKALLLYGTGANGKSVIFDVMNALIGPENISNFSLSDLLGEHNRALIANKLLNYGSEINASVTRDVFKNLVSGEPIMARLKYGNSFLMNRYAKLCFNCNELPRDIEHSEAYFRRLMILPFRLTIPEGKQDKELAQKIIKTELAGVFNWVLEGLRRLLRNRRFTNSEIVKTLVTQYRREADTVACFLDEEGWKSSTDDSYITQKDFHRDYKSFCVEGGYKPVGRVNFGKRLETLGLRNDRKDIGKIVYATRT